MMQPFEMRSIPSEVELSIFSLKTNSEISKKNLPNEVSPGICPFGCIVVNLFTQATLPSFQTNLGSFSKINRSL